MGPVPITREQNKVEHLSVGSEVSWGPVPVTGERNKMEHVLFVWSEVLSWADKWRAAQSGTLSLNFGLK